MSQLDGKTQSSDTTSSTGEGAVQRSAGKRLMVESVYGAADSGIASSGGTLPFMDQIQASFGAHDVTGVRAHTDGAAAAASASMGATAYAKGNDVAFGGAPDLHTAAHEAAHVVQQRAGVHLKGGVGEAGDVYEQHADAVADRVVAGQSAEGLLDVMAGNQAGVAAVQSKAIQFLGQALDKPLDPSAEQPAFGEKEGEQRKWSPDQYIAMWEKEQGRKLTPEEKETIDRGCIGITANNLNGGGNPLASAEKIFGDFDRAHATMVEKNKSLDWMAKIPIFGSMLAGKTRYVVFAKLFWSNQSEKWEDRLNHDDKAFQPDPKTGEVDMTGYKYKAQSRWRKDPKTGEMKKGGYVNFDYGFWDEASSCFWHANHMQYKDDRAKDDPMIVLQSTKDKFTAGYFDFDRIIFCVAKAENYDPGLAAIAHAGGP